MRDIKRIDRITKMLAELWKKNPDWRFGQMLINLNIVPDNLFVWNNEDKNLEEYFKILKANKK